MKNHGVRYWREAQGYFLTMIRVKYSMVSGTENPGILSPNIKHLSLSTRQKGGMKKI
jgi:hypothetical protein